MEIVERFEKIGQFEDEYKDEFSENGLKNLKIVKDKKNEEKEKSEEP